MKRTMPKAVLFCDICEKEPKYQYLNTCMGCGKEICSECSDKGLMIKYAHSIWASGSGDGYFCVDCDKAPSRNISEIHQKYLLILRLRRESDLFYKDFKERCDKAEKELIEILKAKNLY